MPRLRFRRLPLFLAAIEVYEREYQGWLLVLPGEGRVEPGEVGYFNPNTGSWRPIGEAGPDLAALGFPLARTRNVTPAETSMTRQTLELGGAGAVGAGDLFQIRLGGRHARSAGVILVPAAVEHSRLDQYDAIANAVKAAIVADRWDARWCLPVQVKSVALPDTSAIEQAAADVARRTTSDESEGERLAQLEVARVRLDAQKRPSFRIMMRSRQAVAEFKAQAPVAAASPVPITAALDAARFSSSQGCDTKQLATGQPLALQCWRVSDQYTKRKVTTFKVLGPDGEKVSVGIDVKYTEPVSEFTDVPARQLVTAVTPAQLQADWEAIQEYRLRQGAKKPAIASVLAVGVAARRLVRRKNDLNA